MANLNFRCFVPFYKQNYHKKSKIIPIISLTLSKCREYSMLIDCAMAFAIFFTINHLAKVWIYPEMFDYQQFAYVHLFRNEQKNVCVHCTRIGRHSYEKWYTYYIPSVWFT